MFPGYNIAVGFGPTTRPWYINAKSTKHLALTTHTDAITHKIVTGLSKSIRINDEVVMVIGMDIKLKLIKHIIMQSKKCSNGKYKCFLIDKNGDFVFHEHIESKNNFSMENNNIKVHEYSIYQDLLNRNFINELRKVLIS